MPQLLGLIFDLDGTLVDSADDLRCAVNNLLAAHHRRALNIEEIKGMIGDGMRMLVHRAFAATGEPLSEAAELTVMSDMLHIYQAQLSSPEMLYPLAAETLTRFREAGVKIGLCTNKLYIPTIKLLDDIGITKLFDFVAGSDTFAVFKPNPGHVLGVARSMHVPAQNCVMVGDSINDIRAAQGAKITSIAVTHGYGVGVADLGASAIINHFSELPQALEKLGFAWGQ